MVFSVIKHKGYPIIACLFGCIGALKLYARSDKLLHRTQNLIDEKFTEKHNNKILYAVE